MADTIRQGIDKDELGPWFNVMRRSMLGTPLDDDAVEERRPRYDLSRGTAAVDDGGRLCGTAYAFPTELTVPGGVVRAAGVTNVGVLPTHRRRGHLGRMMRAQLADIAARDEPVAVLIAAEYPIYGRYGYGPATEACRVVIDAGSIAGGPDDGWTTPPTGRIELVDADTLFAALPDLYDRARLRAPGHIAWDDVERREVAGLTPPAWGPDQRDTPKVLWYDDEGRVQGAAAYRVENAWERNRPRGHVDADQVIAATDEAEREVVRYLTSVDWTTTVRMGLRPVDDPVPLWLHDGRAAALVDRSDHVWARIMDVPTALTARRYASPGRLVVQVEDPLGFAGGRFLLDTTGDADDPAGRTADCTPTDVSPDLVVPAKALGAAYLGGTSWARLAAGGWVDEQRPGAVATATAMFAGTRAPWCARTF